MTGMLASVSTLPEALQVLAAGVDIIDLKQPAQGALGALSLADARHIVQTVAGRCPVSATIGDLPMQPDIIVNAVQAMAETGVNYIKIGFFPDGDWLATIAKLAVLTKDFALIAVLFADTQPEINVISSLKQHGFTGVMLDTMNKNKGSLTTLMMDTEIAGFVNEAKAQQLLCGLAGSLKLGDIKGLLPYQADYLGFRGALCLQNNRTSQLDEQAIRQVLQTIRLG